MWDVRCYAGSGMILSLPLSLQYIGPELGLLHSVPVDNEYEIGIELRGSRSIARYNSLVDI